MAVCQLKVAFWKVLLVFGLGYSWQQPQDSM